MKKLKNLVKVLLLIFIVNFIPVNAYVWDSLFGIEHVGATESEDGERSVYVEFNESFSSDIKEVKLHTKVYNYEYDYYTGEYKSTVVDGPILNLNTKEGNQFIGVLKEEQITSFGSYEVDKIEITLKDGSKRVSYNKKYYDSLSGNDKENGELIYYHSIFNETIQLSVENGKLEFNIVKLGQAQNYSFDIKSHRANVSADKVYVTFESLYEESNREQVVIAEKLEDGKYNAKLTLNNSLDTGNWRVSEIKVVDNYNREYELEHNNWEDFKVVSANTDIEAPKLNSIELSSNVYDAKTDEPVKFTLDITDDFSGFDYGYIYIKNGNESDIIYISNYDLQDGNYVTAYSWFGENGTWKIERIELRDNAGNDVEYVQELKEYMIDNNRYVQMNFSDKFIEVTNVEENETNIEANIEILEVINNKPEVSNGNEINLEVKLKSDVVLYSIQLNLKAGNIDKYIYLSNSVYYEYDENGNIIENEDGIYTFIIKEDRDSFKYLGSDKYKVTDMYVHYSSNNGNSNHKHFADDDNGWIGDESEVYDFSKLDFICENPNEDINPPKVLEISLDKQIITPGETVEITIKIEDDNSGFIDEYGSYRHLNLYYSNNNTNRDVHMDDISFDKELNQYKGKITIPEYYSTGKYNISYMNIYDVADNNEYYNWYNEEDKELLSQGTILVKTDLNEKLPPEISTEIKNDGQEFKAPYTPIVSSDHGTLEMLLDGKEYDGGPINKLGNHQLYIKAIGIDGSESTKLVSFKVIGEINNDTKPEEIVEQIVSSPEEVVEVEVNSESKEIDKSIFEAIKGVDKTVSFKQDDGTVWSFNGKDITDEKLQEIENIKISVSNTPEEENKEPIEQIDSEARVIHFDYHGVLPGKATVKVKVDNYHGLLGQELTFYYFNPETQKAEKVQGPLSIDNDGFVTVEIEHCSDYFLSADDALHLDAPVITVESDSLELLEGESKYINVEVEPVSTELEYSSSDETVATVDAYGLVSAIKEGTAKITVKAGETIKEINIEVKKSEVVEVPENPEEQEETENPVLPVITVESDSLELLEGEKKALNAKAEPANTKLEYSSSDETVATVDENGLVSSIKEGTAKITVKAGEITKEINIEVKKKKNVEKPVEKPVESPVIPPVIPEEPKVSEKEEEKPESPITPIISIEREILEVLVGEARNLNAKVTPENTELEYISSNKNIVDVNKKGHIIANSPGEAVIIVRAGEVVKEIKVVVREREKAIETPEETSENKPEETNEKQDPSKENKENLPKTGAVVSTSHIVVFALLVMCAGVALLNKKKVVK